jgi:hypothetical protein
MKLASIHPAHLHDVSKIQFHNFSYYSIFEVSAGIFWDTDKESNQTPRGEPVGLLACTEFQFPVRSKLPSGV